MTIGPHWAILLPVEASMKVVKVTKISLKQLNALIAAGYVVRFV